MANKMLIDATHPEETRVVVLRGNRVEEFDFESASRKQLRGNIYLAKVTRVEPSLQAAFVDYGGNRHGFLAFSEIHPDYYQIPVADRQALIDEDSRAQRDADDEDDRGRRRNRHRQRGADRNRNVVRSDNLAGEEAAREAAEIPVGDTPQDDNATPSAHHDHADASHENSEHSDHHDDHGHDEHAQDDRSHEHHADDDHDEAAPVETAAASATEAETHEQPSAAEHAHEHDHAHDDAGEHAHDEHRAAEQHASDQPHDEHQHDPEHPPEIVESVGGEQDAMEEMPERAPRYRRQYKIQEVIKRRQVMLVQVVKEERGTKGAALTTYLSLAGRYSVLMPNTARGGGISRKITSAEDRRRLKEVAEELEVPEGMGVILRTAGASRTKTEVKRDFEYLMRLWETVRDLTLKSTAPKLVYEEGSLVKRSIRDLYHKEIDEIIVEGDAAYREAKEFMRMLMPSHAKNVKPYKDGQPVFARFGIEAQLDAMFQPTVQLKSGGYIVLNQTEALVAIDVNSGRATREHNIEDTALKTNLEASAEVARQLRLRDLAGLIVIDFIDMEENRNNRAVERKIKESLKSDRARIQVGRISHFGLLEMSRQRIRTSVLESSTETCPHCGGTGHVRSVSSVALQLIRGLEEMLLKGGTHNLIARTRSDVALYVLNHKRAHLRALEERFKILIAVNADNSVTGQPPFAVDRGEQVMTIEQAKAILAQTEHVTPVMEEQDILDENVPDEMEDADEERLSAPAGADDGGHAEEPGEASPQGEQDENRRRRRGRRGRGGRGREGGRDQHQPREPMQPQGFASGGDFAPSENGDAEPNAGGFSGGDQQPGQPRPQGSTEEGERRRRRRGRRGGRRNRRDRDPNAPQHNGNGQNGDAVHGQDNQHDQSEHEPQHNEPQPPYAPREDSTPGMNEALSTSSPQRQDETAEQFRRRSTVREPAPRFDADDTTSTPAASPSPAASAPAPEPAAESQANQPRRFGWWSRKS